MPAGALDSAGAERARAAFGGRVAGCGGGLEGKGRFGSCFLNASQPSGGRKSHKLTCNCRQREVHDKSPRYEKPMLASDLYNTGESSMGGGVGSGRSQAASIPPLPP